jgi:Glyoxalase/Bleomycin resistance protein/Dioxygenase superfamily
MSLHRLLGFRAAVADPTALAGYYAELGLTGDAASGYTGSDGGAVVRIDEAPFRRLVSVDIGCHDDRDLDAVEKRLETRGAAPRRDSESISVLDAASRVQITVRIAEAEAVVVPAALVTPNTPGARPRVNERAPAVFGAPRPPRRLGHLVIGTPDLRATRDLLVDGIGCKVSDEFDGIIHFLRCSTDHHNIGLVHSPVPILQHYSWECDDIDHVGHTATALYRADTSRHAWGLGRHFAGSNFYWYLRDPAGSFLELYSDFDSIDDDDAWEQNRSPLSIEHAANAWGPNLPTEFVVPDDLTELEAGWAGLSTRSHARSSRHGA